MQDVWERLVPLALAAREHAHAPYSGYAVGAALALEDGTTFSGCNVENASFGLTLCAERAALAAMVAAGRREPRALVVATASEPPASPCGVCRQALAEFAHELPILLVNPDGGRRQTSLEDLLPDRFDLPRR